MVAKQLYVVSTDEALRNIGPVLYQPRAKKAQSSQEAVLFLHLRRLGFTADFVVGSANAECIHSVF